MFVGYGLPFTSMIKSIVNLKMTTMWHQSLIMTYLNFCTVIQEMPRLCEGVQQWYA